MSVQALLDAVMTVEVGTKETLNDLFEAQVIVTEEQVGRAVVTNRANEPEPSTAFAI